MDDAEAPSTALKVRVHRGTTRDGHLQYFEVPKRANQTVLDIVTWIQRNLDSSLSYRFACRVGMCGSCAMMVNGIPRWTCRSHVEHVAPDGELTIEPLRNLPVIKDLACDMSPFFDKWERAGGRFAASGDRHGQMAAIAPTDPKRIAASAAIECINCAVCYSACDVVSADPDYLGPAALNRAWSLQNDARDANHATRLAVLASSGRLLRSAARNGHA